MMEQFSYESDTVSCFPFFFFQSCPVISPGEKGETKRERRVIETSNDRVDNKLLATAVVCRSALVSEFFEML